MDATLLAFDREAARAEEEFASAWERESQRREAKPEGGKRPRRKPIPKERLRKKFFYLGANRRVTICLLYDMYTEHYSRGISICSFQDPNLSSEGRAKAEGRALQALYNESTDCHDIICRHEAIEVLKEEGIYPFLVGAFRGEFMPDLLPIEDAILFKWVTGNENN